MVSSSVSGARTASCLRWKPSVSWKGQSKLFLSGRASWAWDRQWAGDSEGCSGLRLLGSNYRSSALWLYGLRQTLTSLGQAEEWSQRYPLPIPQILCVLSHGKGGRRDTDGTISRPWEGQSRWLSRGAQHNHEGPHTWQRGAGDLQMEGKARNQGMQVALGSCHRKETDSLLEPQVRNAALLILWRQRCKVINSCSSEALSCGNWLQQVLCCSFLPVHVDSNNPYSTESSNITINNCDLTGWLLR